MLINCQFDAAKVAPKLRTKCATEKIAVQARRQEKKVTKSNKLGKKLHKTQNVV